MPGDRAELLDALIDEIAERVAAKIAACTAERVRDDRAEYCDARTAPCGRKRFLAAARRGEFPSFLDGRTIKARRADVRAWLEGHPHPRLAAPPDYDPAPAAPATAALDARIDAWRDRQARRLAKARKAG